MKNNILTSVLCSSVFLLTACGGGDSDTHYTGKEKLDFNKAETIELISEPIIFLSNDRNNPISYTAYYAETIHYSVTDPSITTTCETGEIVKNTNGSITLNNCKNLKIDGEFHDEESNHEDVILSGTIQTHITDTANLEQYEITLNQFTIKYEDGAESYDGKIVQKYSSAQPSTYVAQTDVNNMKITFVDDKNKQVYILSDYRLIETTSSATVPTSVALGKLQGDLSNKIFSVNFTSQMKFGNQNPSHIPSDVNISIKDTANIKNEITIEKALNNNPYQFQISAFADGKSVAGFPKLGYWDDYLFD